MTKINHQCHRCLATAWIQEIDDGKDEWRGALDADCGCATDEQSEDYDDD